MITRFHTALVFALAATMSQATILLPGGRVGRGTADAPGSLTIFADAGTLLDQTTQTFSNASISGSVVSAVFVNSDGLLDFGFQLSVNQSSSAINRITLFNYGNFSTDVGYMDVLTSPFPSVGTVLASEVNRSADGSVVGWDYDFGQTGLNAGTTTFGMIVKTNATAYQAGNVGVIDGITANVSGFAPVPEPASLAVLAIGAASLLLRRRAK